MKRAPLSTTKGRSHERLKVFLSYAHRDERLQAELNKHLAPLRRSALIDVWHDRKIDPGKEVDTEIDKRLMSADIVLLLVSPDFINSDYCYQREMKAALRRHAAGRARVIPVILRPVDWLKTPIGKLLAIPKDGNPISTSRHRDKAFLDVATNVRHVVEEIITERISITEPTSRSRTRRVSRTPFVVSQK